jgi:hypothetical protein
MTTDIASSLIAGILPLVAAGLGAAATIAVQRGTTKAARDRFTAEIRASHREEVKTAVLDYLNHAQQLQGQLDARERGEPASDLKRLVEELWLAEKGVEIICSQALRDRLVAHARGLHDVVRDPQTYPDWWARCADLQYDLLAEVKQELTHGRLE